MFRHLKLKRRLPKLNSKISVNCLQLYLSVGYYSTDFSRFIVMLLLPISAAKRRMNKFRDDQMNILFEWKVEWPQWHAGTESLLEKVRLGRETPSHPFWKCEKTPPHEWFCSVNRDNNKYGAHTHSTPYTHLTSPFPSNCLFIICLKFIEISGCCTARKRNIYNKITGVRYLYTVCHTHTHRHSHAMHMRSARRSIYAKKWRWASVRVR